MTVGFHAPLPPARTGVAEYSAALLRALREYGRVEVAPRRAGIRLYHLGNNQLHREAYRCALAEPGVVVLHDAVLQHFFLGWLDRAPYIEEFVYNYGEWNRGLAGELWDSRAQSAARELYFRFPMLRRIAETSRAVIVHNPGAARMVREHAPRARVCEIPHLFAPPLPVHAAEVERLRGRLGGRVIFTVMGYLRESKRLPVVLDAMEQLRRQDMDATLVLVGEFVSADLARLMRPRLAQANVRHTGRVAERDFRLLAAAADACVNLRHPAAGETSGIGVRMMGLGRPVIFTDCEEVSRLPDDACLKVAQGVSEKDELAHYMALVCRSGALAREIGSRAAAYVSRRHSVERAARLYWEVLRGSPIAVSVNRDVAGSE